MVAITVLVPVAILSRYPTRHYEKMTASTLATVTSVTPGPQRRMNSQWYPSILITYEYTVGDQIFRFNDSIVARNPNAFDDYPLNGKFKICYDPQEPEVSYSNTAAGEKCGERR